MEVKVVTKDERGNPMGSKDITVIVDPSTTVKDVKDQINPTLISAFIPMTFTMNGLLANDDQLIGNSTGLKYCIRY